MSKHTTSPWFTTVFPAESRMPSASTIKSFRIANEDGAFVHNGSLTVTIERDNFVDHIDFEDAYERMCFEEKVVSYWTIDGEFNCGWNEFMRFAGQTINLHEARSIKLDAFCAISEVRYKLEGDIEERVIKNEDVYDFIRELATLSMVHAPIVDSRFLI